MAVCLGHVCIQAEIVETTRPGDSYRTYAPTGRRKAWWGRVRIPVFVARAYFRVMRWQ